MAIRSMTAFARWSAQHEWGSAAWEIRSVNHRYLELQCKLPEGWRHLEPVVRESARHHLQRGKVECQLRVQLEAARGDDLEIDYTLAQTLIDATRRLNGQLDDPAPVSALEILAWPGVTSTRQPDSEALGEVITEGLEAALVELSRGRGREGAELAKLLEQRLLRIAEITTELRDMMPAIIDSQRDRLRQRVAELQAQIEPERLEAEVALLAQKLDVDEELDRLSTHVEEVRRVLAKGGACGRRLDFLMQELNREANTLSSKAVVSESSQGAVELKVLIEQMREQIQNIE